MRDIDDLKTQIEDALHPERKYPDYPRHAEIFQAILAELNARWQHPFTLLLTQEQTEAIQGYGRRWHGDDAPVTALICQVNGTHAPLTYHDDGAATLTYPGC